MGGLKRKPLLSKAEEVGRAAPGVGGAPKNLFEGGLPQKGQFLEGVETYKKTVQNKRQ